MAMSVVDSTNLVSARTGVGKELVIPRRLVDDPASFAPRSASPTMLCALEAKYGNHHDIIMLPICHSCRRHSQGTIQNDSFEGFIEGLPRRLIDDPASVVLLI